MLDNVVLPFSSHSTHWTRILFPAQFDDILSVIKYIAIFMYNYSTFNPFVLASVIPSSRWAPLSLSCLHNMPRSRTGLNVEFIIRLTIILEFNAVCCIKCRSFPIIMIVFMIESSRIFQEVCGCIILTFAIETISQSI